ncbi:hypothetical protein ACF1A5_06570 [Streptomyces sp. NPDC014864]|uniref:hypothetical protein n=1 Tax=Streptomyces sp. NPDC014864 TaxID=3364924 RepID=UPI0036F9E210
MVEHRDEAPGENGAPVPRDMQDQQAHTGEAPWEDDADRERGGAGEPAEAPSEGPDIRLPDTDEAGTGRKGAPHSGTVHPEHPVPDESSA